MATQSLLHYLSIALPAIPIQGAAPSRNTTNPRYGPDDITEVVTWQEFNYANILQQYGAILNAKQIRPDPFPSPPAAIRDEPQFHLRFAEMVLPRVRRALRAGFEQLAPQLPARQLSQITFDGGSAAALLDQFKPDTAYVVVGGNYANSTNRGPGDLKVSWKWKSSLRFSRVEADQNEYKQVLSQVNFYMKQHGARYGYILTNTEFVAVKRLNSNGRLAVANPIPWTSGSIGQPSVLLGLWYLGMLVAENNNWALTA
ncbi:hypothetical protein KXW98_007105 [Aspergillus fumigatus]|uniref:Uncharacterized protein n=1 Tax=Aspergillus fumigatus (strain CBS 144.89 / FGSC A1163 / CEA10) TaxID=451804 RepID=B0Y8X0_ASPFC|nr:conserved hypothetical protein [Aspergillus fumigatus A1163]KAF4260675.1 hypothetical protein CNMCM8057_002151 [Aspergillus fumigatus]KAF4293004.1 hypothetical protein CNMCM8686_006784 [Aspergillus fumigatus]KAH1275826.1 hypothetical protein KXX45_005858 [Aspergillus fumigatus]KAH1288156.1 hypothetical protein KXX30_007924 [Aspergillus fumigatus]